MNSKILTLALLGLLALACFATEESDVVVLTAANFDDFLKENPYTLIKFYIDYTDIYTE